MAEKKVVKATKEATTHTVKPAKATGNAGANRAGAIICWLLALACEAVGILALFGKITVTFMPTLYFIIAVLVVDLIFVILGSTFWKKANHIDPASEKNKVKFFLWNNMGVIVCIIAFLPYIILLLKDKNLDKKTRTIAVVAAVVALVIGGLTSVDYNPVSEEQLASAQQYVEGTVYYTQFGKCYHIDQDCSALNNSDTLYECEDVDQAIANNRTKLCSFCAKRNNVNGEVATDNKEVE